MISAIILAAGESKRMGRPKQLLLYQGRTLIERAVATVLASEVSQTIVVLGHQADAISAVVARCACPKPVKAVFNPHYRQGLSASIKVGLENVSPAAAAVLIMLGDQPGLTPETINRLIAAFKERRGAIIVPVHRGRRGNPVLFDIKYKPELLALSGDAGARQLLAVHPEDVVEVEVASEGILQDIDTEEDFRRLGGRTNTDALINDVP